MQQLKFDRSFGRRCHRAPSLDCRWSRESRSTGPWGASSLGSDGAAGAGTPADAVDTASLSGGDFGLLQQGGQGDMLESRHATPRRARPLATFVRAPPGSSPPRDPSLIYLPWPGRSAICGGRRTFFPPAAFSACAPQQPQHPRARTAHPRHRELLQGDKISYWRPPYGQQDLNLSSARLV